MRTTILGAEEPERALAVCRERAEFYVAEIGLALQKAKMPFRLETVKTFLEAKESYALSSALVALGVGGMTYPVSLAALSIAATASVSLSLRFASGVNKIPDSLRDFAYVYRANREFTTSAPTHGRLG